MTRPTSLLGDPFPSKRPPASRRRSSAGASAAFEASFARGLDLSNVSSSNPPTAAASASPTAPPYTAHRSASARLLAAKALEARFAEDERREERLMEEGVELMRVRQHRSAGRTTTTASAIAGHECGGNNLRFTAPEAATLPPPPSLSGSGVDCDGGGLAAAASAAYSSWNGSLVAAVVSMHGGDRAGANRERGRCCGSKLHGGGSKLVRRNAIVKRRRTGLASCGVPSSARGSGTCGGGGGGGAKFYTKKHVNVAKRNGLGKMKRRKSSSI